MCGFVKKEPTTTCNVPSGIPTFDKLVRLQRGSLTCIYEDPNSFIHTTLLQIFISSCLDSQLPCLALSSEEKLYRRFEKQIEEQSKNIQEAKDSFIAWRYKLQTVENEPRCSWNLLKKLDLESESRLSSLDDLLAGLKSSEPKNFVIFSLFGPLYGDFDRVGVFRILYEIRKQVKINKHQVYLSLPRFLIEDPIEIFFDNIVQVHSNLLMPGESSLYNGYLEILKLANSDGLRINDLESYKYGIALKAKKISVEKIDIPPEEISGGDGCTASF